MSLTLPERRRIAIISGEQRVDLAVPLDDTLGDVLQGMGYTIEPGRHVVLERSGAEAKLTVRGSDLVDGAMYSIIDLRTQLTGGRSATAADPLRNRGASWWMLAMVAVVAVGVQVVDAGGAGSDAALQRLLASAALGIAAVASALVWAKRHPQDLNADAISMLSPLALAFAAGFVIIPLTLVEGVHLAVLTGLLLSAVLAALLTATIGAPRLRSSAGVATIILLSLGAIWGVTLLAGMDVAAAAVISAGAVPLALRALPTTLLNLDDGYQIDYQQFMSNRWTVRGTIPVSPTEIGAGIVREEVEDSTARLLSGTLLLSAVPVIMVPVALSGGWQQDPLVLGGSIGVLVTVIIGLLLISRHTATQPLRWAPRAAAALVLVEATAGVAITFGSLAITIAAASFLAIGLLAAAVLVPIGRGARSLAWSRLADVLEAIAVALSLPAALLAADVLSIVRGMMAG